MGIIVVACPPWRITLLYVIPIWSFNCVLSKTGSENLYQIVALQQLAAALWYLVILLHCKIHNQMILSCGLFVQCGRESFTIFQESHCYGVKENFGCCLLQRGGSHGAEYKYRNDSYVQ